MVLAGAVFAQPNVARFADMTVPRARRVTQTRDGAGGGFGRCGFGLACFQGFFGVFERLLQSGCSFTACTYCSTRLASDDAAPDISSSLMTLALMSSRAFQNPSTTLSFFAGIENVAGGFAHHRVVGIVELVFW